MPKPFRYAIVSASEALAIVLGANLPNRSSRYLIFSSTFISAMLFTGGTKLDYLNESFTINSTTGFESSNNFLLFCVSSLGLNKVGKFYSLIRESVMETPSILFSTATSLTFSSSELPMGFLSSTVGFSSIISSSLSSSPHLVKWSTRNSQMCFSPS